MLFVFLGDKLLQGLAYVFLAITSLLPLIHCSIVVKGVKGAENSGQLVHPVPSLPHPCYAGEAAMVNGGISLW